MDEDSSYNVKKKSQNYGKYHLECHPAFSMKSNLTSRIGTSNKSRFLIKDYEMQDSKCLLIIRKHARGDDCSAC